jgi:predicted nucleotidyltransferase
MKIMLEPIFKRHGVVRASVFGSFARGDEQKNSDVDLLVQFKTHPGLGEYLETKRSLESALKRRVDLVTERSLNRHVKPHVLKELKVIYDQKG